MMMRVMTAVALFALAAAAGCSSGPPSAPSFTPEEQEKNIEEAKTHTKVMSNALRQFNMTVRRFPTEAEGLSALLTRPADAQGWDGPYIRNWDAVPPDPWGNRYVYRINVTASGREEPHVICYGADGQPGGRGPAADIDNGQVAEP